MTEATKEYPAWLRLISGKYRDRGHRLLSSRNANGCSMRFQYSKKPNTMADRMPLEERGSPILQKIAHSQIGRASCRERV